MYVLVRYIHGTTTSSPDLLQIFKSFFAEKQWLSALDPIVLFIVFVEVDATPIEVNMTMMNNGNSHIVENKENSDSVATF